MRAGRTGFADTPEIRKATLVRWYRNDGDLVRRDEAIGEIETDNVSIDIAAPHAGVLRQLAKIGDMVGTGVDIARIDRDE